MALPPIPPEKDLLLRDFAVNFDTLTGLTPAAFGLLASQCTALHGKVVDFLARLTAATDPATRTKVTLEAKRVSKAALVSDLKALMRIVNAYPGTTDTQRVSLGMRVKDTTPSPVPPPATQVVVAIGATGGGQAQIRFRDQTTPDKPAKPAGVFAALMRYEITPAGAPAPSLDDGKFDQVVTRTNWLLPLPPGTAGHTLWVQARWMNERGQPGPASTVTSMMIAA